jgi:4-amino-4-deoxy-L-arabinose transferase-like glycosyltransferase
MTAFMRPRRPDAGRDGPGARHGLSPGGAAILLGLTAGLSLFRLGAVPLLGPDEPRYARVAVEMSRSGDLVTPTLQGRPWLEKPPLYYWLAAAAYSVLGETETAARLPSAAAGLLMVGATALIGARLYGGAAGLHAGFVLATSLLPFAYARAASMDALLAATATVASGLLGLRLLGIAGAAAVPAAYAFMGLAVLAKGPLGVLLPGLVVLAHAAATRSAAGLRRVVTPGGVALLLLVAGPWYALALRAQGRTFIDVFFLNHNLERFTSTIHHHPGPFFYYVPVVLAGLLPWSGLVVSGLGGLRPRLSRADAYVLAWLAAPLAFFSLAGSKLPGYVLPCLPPVALLVGRSAAEMTAGRDAPPPWATRRVAAAIGLAVAALVVGLPLALRRAGDPGWAGTAPLAVWALVVAGAAATRLPRRPAAALRLLRVGGAGFLLLLTLAAPPILARRESGRALFAAAAGREVQVWGAWRTAWMAGYFYNDGRVREVSGLAEIEAAAQGGPQLVLCGPAERRQLSARRTLGVRTLARGPRDNVLLEVERP